MKYLTVALLMATAPVAARPANKVIMATDPVLLAAEQQFGFADAVVSGDMVYLSGVIVTPRPGETDLMPAFDRVFADIGHTLKRAGSSWDDVVEINSFHKDLPGQAAAIVAVKAKYVRAPYPAWTALQISRLLTDDGVAEVKVVARRSKH